MLPAVPPLYLFFTLAALAHVHVSLGQISCPSLGGIECNGGACIAGTCKCGVGIVGPICELVCPGAPQSCSGHGQCYISEGIAVCACNSDRRGAVCDKRCPLGVQGDVCSSRGLCNNDAECVCITGFRGANCSIECPGGGHNICNGRGACLDDGSCLCDAGYAGQSCDKVCPGSKPEVGFVCNGHGSCNQADATCSCFKWTPPPCKLNTTCPSCCLSNTTAGAIDPISYECPNYRCPPCSINGSCLPCFIPPPFCNSSNASANCPPPFIPPTFPPPPTCPPPPPNSSNYTCILPASAPPPCKPCPAEADVCLPPSPPAIVAYRGTTCDLPVFLGVNDDVNASEYLFRKKTDKPNLQQPVKWVAWVVPVICLVVCLFMFIARYIGQEADKLLLAHGDANKTIQRMFGEAGSSVLDTRKKQAQAAAPPKRKSKNKRD